MIERGVFNFFEDKLSELLPNHKREVFEEMNRFKSKFSFRKLESKSLKILKEWGTSVSTLLKKLTDKADDFSPFFNEFMEVLEELRRKTV